MEFFIAVFGFVLTSFFSTTQLLSLPMEWRVKIFSKSLRKHKDYEVGKGNIAKLYKYWGDSRIYSLTKGGTWKVHHEDRGWIEREIF